MARDYSELFKEFERAGVKIPKELKEKLSDRINNMINYEPKVGFFGKTGAGKSSLCNSLFGQDICGVSDIEACTREPKEVFLGIASKGIKLLDVPGVGENVDRDKEYAQLYSKLLPELDLVLWVLKGDDRAFTSDETFYKQVVKPHLDQGKPFFLVINQVDKIEPFREWDEKEHRPSPKQASNIEAKRQAVSSYFGLPIQQILPVSANEKYGLVELVDAVIYALPKEKQINVATKLNNENLSKETKKHAEQSFADAVIDMGVEILVPKPLQEVTKTVLKKAKDFICDLFSWW